MLKVYERERREAIARSRAGLRGEQFFTEQALSHLPAPVQKYFHATGYLDKPVMYNAEVIWKDSYIKLQPGKPWQQLKTRQFNSVNPLARIAYMKFLTMPVAGRDIYQSGQGEMKGKLLNLFTIINGRGRDVSQAALITVFCEFLFIPSYALQDYVTWEDIGGNAVRARLVDHDFDVTGQFYFDDEGLFTRFETWERPYEKDPRSKVKFSAVVDGYQTMGDTRIPYKVSIVWHLPDGDYEYYKGTIDRILCNVSQ
jgi:hypothetical protein